VAGGVFFCGGWFSFYLLGGVGEGRFVELGVWWCREGADEHANDFSVTEAEGGPWSFSG